MQLMVPSLAMVVLITFRYFSYHGIFLLEDIREPKRMQWIKITWSKFKSRCWPFSKHGSFFHLLCCLLVLNIQSNVFFCSCWISGRSLALQFNIWLGPTWSHCCLAAVTPQKFTHTSQSQSPRPRSPILMQHVIFWHNEMFLQVLEYPLCRFCLHNCQDTRTCNFFISFFYTIFIACSFWRLLSRWKLPWCTAGTISEILTIHTIGFTRMTACFSLEISRTESKCLEEANVLPNSTVTAIIAAVPWLQMLKQLFCDTPGTEDITGVQIVCWKLFFS